MPKAKRNKKGAVRKNTAGPRSDTIRRDTNITTGGHTEATARRAERTARAGSYQALIMPGMVMVGCLGLAISFSFFTTDPNRFLYGGMAALMALMWAYSFWSRLRKVLRSQKQQ